MPTSTTVSPNKPSGSAPKGNASLAQAAAQRAQLNRDQFLRLLVTQLRNQDPFNPLQGQEFAAQLAQFSSVEQLIQINQGLAQHFQSSGLWSQSLYHLLAAGLIGKEAKVQASAVFFDGERPAPISMSLSERADALTLRLKDASGRVVRTLQLGPHAAGSHELLWDGTDERGNRLPRGLYRIEVEAQASGKPVDVKLFLVGLITKVQYTGDGAKLWVGDIPVDWSAVEEIRQPQQGR
ncbi:MAG: flagellar hook capping protein [Bacteroidetes bacterium]|nr:flagellar hook capping protein [Rhodothermia bacterium]MCS7154671.1 flagellar hook capping protein [Bacteroidota bacterium]MCX7906388.1 flagellar hook capping protein [Bacteroidota bacterium]MDW8137464.1 FlgD immunoglobulin-like domain containing protein [Bacteroidota bacterium]MDW8285582.1 FlgD immunoglobulin-like domain containing protein [Bacteroidota bacterium]